MCAASTSRCSATPRCRWSRAASSPNGSDGRLTFYGAAKVPFPNRRILAKQMGLAEAAIRMVENDVGGGFGVRGEFYPEDFLIPFAARFIGRPVKWIEDRREHLIATNHARDVACELEIACDRDGTILALRGHAKADVGAYIRTNGATGRAQHRADPLGTLSGAEHPHAGVAPRHQQDPGRHLSRARAVSKPISFASACSTWRRATSASIAPSSAAAT